ncbi:chaperone modulator CbpM [Mucilaginibacter terrae]|uniref:chaperone modulator CbpM n=1 Tax=Mucilaginibacter terrae TaxID=1955052 RepID=UPI00362EAEF7
MENQNLTAALDFCSYYQIEYTLLNSFEEAGLVELTVVNETRYISQTQLPGLERMVRLHHELDINVAGIEAITHLLQRVQAMQQEMLDLRNRLKSYE